VKNRESGQQVHVIIIDSSADEFVRRTLKLVSDCEIDYELCPDIYSAAAQLVTNHKRNIFIIGRFEALNKEAGWIFRKADEGDVCCCCLACSAASRRKAAAFKGAGIFVVSELEDVEAEVMKVLQTGFAFAPRIGKRSSVVFNREQFAASRAEIDALLDAG